MSQYGSMLCALALALGLALPTPGAAAGDQVDFDVYVLGLRAGTLSYAMQQQGARYAVTGKVRSAGLIGQLAQFRMDATAEGRLGNTGYRPERYVENSLEGDKRTERSIRYDAKGLPVLVSDEKPRDYWVPPARQAGTLDPMTMLYELLRDRTGESPCVLDVTYGDGARIGRVHSAPQSTQDGEVTCRGEYERKGGFSTKELKDGTQFPFTLHYRRDGDQWELTKLLIDSVHGRARLVRR